MCQGTPFYVWCGVCMSVDIQGQLLKFIRFSPSTLQFSEITLRSWDLPLPAELSPHPQYFLLFFFIFNIFILTYIKIWSYLPLIFPPQLPPTSPTFLLSASCLFFFDDLVSPVCSAHTVWVWDPQEHRKTGKNETDITRTCYQKSTVSQLYESKGT